MISFNSLTDSHKLIENIKILELIHFQFPNGFSLALKFMSKKWRGRKLSIP